MLPLFIRSNNSNTEFISFLCSLKERQETWQSKLDLLPTTKMLAAKCILAAAITVYCGPLKTKARHTFFEKLLAVCRSQDFPTSDDHNLDLAGYPEFILGLVCP